MSFRHRTDTGRRPSEDPGTPGAGSSAGDPIAGARPDSETGTGTDSGAATPAPFAAAPRPSPAPRALRPSELEISAGHPCPRKLPTSNMTP
ncbi:hypothetical protein GCM10018781_31260 [Kitasatospora indigofera]|uniref:Uncharacterized protein n=1 Tax=Kitasatospora indigofera TaxID=67307 RepID=A0A919KSF6_9ACTN|nr:hypothetical protein GCM10018781_31260 [Kitasatospora indigofera]